MDFGDKLGEVFNAYIGRIVAFVLAPLMAVAAPPVVEAVNNVLGTDYSDKQLSNIAIATVVGIALAAFQWLRNRGDWENKLAELHQLYEAGQQHLDENPIALGAPKTEPPTGEPSLSGPGLGDATGHKK